MQPAAVASTDGAFRHFNATLEAQGLREALAYLVGLTDYRFIAIFGFQDGRAAALVYVDRENPDQLMADEVPDTATYCCFVRDSQGLFATADALTDGRLDAHPAREAVRAYCGVPVMDAEGTLFGTLCHYDLVPRDPGQIDLPLLLQVASALGRGGLVPAYPRRP